MYQQGISIVVINEGHSIDFLIDPVTISVNVANKFVTLVYSRPLK